MQVRGASMFGQSLCRLPTDSGKALSCGQVGGSVSKSVLVLPGWNLWPVPHAACDISIRAWSVQSASVLEAQWHRVGVDSLNLVGARDRAGVADLAGQLADLATRGAPSADPEEEAIAT
jgi:hypothetical protein